MNTTYYRETRDLRQDMDDAHLTTTLVLDAYGDQRKVASAGDRVATDGCEGYIEAEDGEIVVVGPEYLSAHDLELRGGLK